MEENTQKYIKEVEVFFCSHLDELLNDDGNLLNETWEKLYTELFNATECNLLTAEIMQAFHGDSNQAQECNLQQETKEILVHALSKLFLRKNYGINDWLSILDWFHIHKEFYSVLKQEIINNKEDYYALVSKISEDIFVHPEALVFKSEKDRFLAYLDTWKTETNVRELWLTGEMSFFPYAFDAFAFPSILLPEQTEQVLMLIDKLKAPYLLYEFLAYCKHFTQDNELLLKFLQKAPLSIENEKNEKWNQSFVAPIILHRLVNEILRQKTNFKIKIDDEEVRQYFEKISKILFKRKDGYFLVWNYLRYLAPKTKLDNRNVSVFSECMEQVLVEKEEQYLRNNPLTELFPEDIKIIKEKFTATGILEPKQKDSICLDIVTHLKSLSDEKQKMDCLPFFEASLMFEDPNLPVYEATPLTCHYDVAEIYCLWEPKEIVARWEQTWNLFTVAQRQIAFSYFSDMSFSLRINLKFVLLVGSALIHWLLNNKELIATQDLWNKLWSVSIEKLRYREGKADDFNLTYAKILVVWKARCEEAKFSPAEAVESTIGFLSSLTTYPELLILSVDCLQMNNCLGNSDLTKNQKDKLRTLLNDALQYCEGIEGERKLHEVGNNCIGRLV